MEEFTLPYSAQDIVDLLEKVSSSVTETALNNALKDYYTKVQSYQKNELYTRIEVDHFIEDLNTVIGSLTSISFAIVDSVAQVLEPGVLYFILKENTENGNIYDEYMYIGGKVEAVGGFNTNVDLSNLVTTNALTTALNGYVKTTEFNNLVTSIGNSYVAKVAGKDLVAADLITKLTNLPTATANDAKYVAKENGKSLVPDTTIAKINSMPSNVVSTSDVQIAVSSALEIALQDVSFVTSQQVQTVVNTSINTAFQNLDVTGTKLSFVKEYANGALEYISDNGIINQTIYTKMISLEGLPNTLGTEKLYGISTEPIGNNIYLVIENVTVSPTTRDAYTTIDNSLYSFSIVQPGANTLPMIKVKCLTANSLNYSAKVRVSYVKYFGEKITFSIECATPGDATNLSLTIPTLKHNKENVIGYSLDDNKMAYYSVAFAAINNRPIMYTNTVDTQWGTYSATQYHANNLPDEEHLTRLGKTIGYTDGCGNERRMKLGYAIWPTDLSRTIDGASTVDYRYMQYYLTWDELKDAIEFGSAIQVHNVSVPNSTVEEIIDSYQVFRDLAITNVGRGFKTTTRPDGNSNYVFASLIYPEHLCMAVETSKDSYIINPYNPAANSLMYKMLVQRTFNDDIQEYYHAVTDEMVKPKSSRVLLNFGTHDTQKEFVDFVLWLNNTYGKNGTDVVWLTHLDEVYEYWYMRKYTKILKTTAGSVANFTVYIPKGQFFYYPELTFITNINIQTPNTLSSNIKGFSFNNTNMFNINLDTQLEVLAEKYTAKYEEHKEPIFKQDALYFTNQLRADLKAVYIARISAADLIALTSLSISGGNITDLLIGETTQLTSTFIPSNTTQTNIQWSSSNNSIATVSSTGLVTCISAGNAVITLTSLDNGTKTATKSITCVASRPITAISITGGTSGVISNTINLTAILTPTNTTQTGITWSSDNETLATVNSSGAVTLLAVGTVHITATSSSNGSIQSSSHAIVIAAEQVALNSLTVNGSTNIEINDTAQFTVTYNPTNTTETAIIWESSNNNIATVDYNTGLVTAIAIGTVTITAISAVRGTVRDDYQLTTIAQVIEVTGLTITGPTNVVTGTPEQYEISYTPSNTTETAVSWSLSETTFATIDENTGVVTATIKSEANTFNVIATSQARGEIMATFAITTSEPVVIPLTGLLMTGVVDRRVGKNYQMPYSLTPSDTTETGLIWSSSNTVIATIDNTGLITPLSAGVTTITVKSASNQSILHTKRLEVFAATTNPVYKLSSIAFNAADILYLEDQGEYATPHNSNGLTSVGFNLIIRNAITGEDMSSLGFSKMSSTQKIAAFGSNGGDPMSPVNQQPPYLSGSSAYKEFTYGGEYGASESIYIGQNVPNGTYNIKWLMATSPYDYTTSGTTLNINGTNIPITIVSALNNETWMDCGNIVVSDGKLKISFTCEAANYFGWNGIIVEKIA